jgi:hypothetical protein
MIVKDNVPVLLKQYQKVCTFLLLLMAYASLACVTTWPLVARIATHLPGGSYDTFLHYWNVWWVQRALSDGQSPFYTSLLFYPEGVSLVTHNIPWFNVLLWSLLEPLLGGIVAYNLTLLFSLTLCGCALFWLTQKLTNDSRAAFLAGVVYEAWPYRLSQLDHPNLLSTQWTPIFFLLLISTIQKGRWRDSVLTGLFFALIGYTRWQQMIPATIMGLIYFICAAPHWLPAGKRYVLSRLVLAGGIAVALLIPAALLLVNQDGSKANFDSLMFEGEGTTMQTDMLAYITPGGSHPVLGRRTQSLYDHYYGDRSSNRRYPAYIGLVTLLLVLLGTAHNPRTSLPWVLMAITLILLAQGSLLRINGQFYPQVPTFYSLLSPIGVVRLMREPDRYNMFLALPISVIAAYGVKSLLTYRQRRAQWQPRLASILLSGLILFEYLLIPVPLYHISSPSPFYTQLGQEQIEFAVLNLPFHRIKAKTYMFDQTIHQRPILQGNLSRLPSGVYSYVDANPWLYVLRRTHEMSPELCDVSHQLAALAKDGVYYIILHKEIEPDRLARWRRYLLAEPRYEDEHIVVHTTSPEAGVDFELVKELAPGLGPIDVLISAGCLNPGRVLEVDVGWGSTNELDQDFDVSISLVDDKEVVRQTESFTLSKVWPTSRWSHNTIAWGYYPLFLSPSIPVGEYAVTLGLLDSETGYSQGSVMSVQAVTVQSQVCDLATDPVAADINVLFGDELQLLEYTLRQDERLVEFTPYWRSQRRMDTDYKIFVHIFDSETGEIVAQDDAMPRRWLYPTTLWWPGETVQDPISISMDDASPGTYGIAIGVYEPLTGERLPLVNSYGQLIPDGRVVLEEVIELK